MCIICAKAANTKLPTYENFMNMWYNNPDGAGLMYTKDGKVRIEKGFMEFEDFTTRLDELKQEIDTTATPMVFHFRIATHGGVNAGCTHPFPVTDNVTLLKKPRATCKLGVAHNGIIDITPRKDLSDTMEYVASQLFPLSKALPRFYDNKWALTLVKNAIDSKMALLTDAGDIHLIGNFEESDGIKYSNHSYAYLWSYRGGKFSTFSGGGWSDWDDDGWEYYGTTSKGYKDYRDKSTGKKKDNVIPLLPEHTVNRLLMPVYLVDGCIKTPDGEYFYGVECEDFFIDSTLKVWYYDVDQDCCCVLPDFVAYDEKGDVLKWDIDLAESTPCELLY